jgi:lipopolysaccharide export system protein LptC
MTYRLIAILAFVALIVGVVVLSGGERQGAAPVAVEAPPDPGYSAKKARLVQTGPDGQPLYTLDADEVQQLPQTGLINLQQVVLGFKDSSGNQWTARGKRGELAQNSGMVKLAGDVHVSGIVPGTSEPAEFTSEHVAFDTNSQIVTTDDPVTLTMSGRKLDAQGMVANLKERHVQLESSVHGSYRP